MLNTVGWEPSSWMCFNDEWIMNDVWIMKPSSMSMNSWMSFNDCELRMTGESTQVTNQPLPVLPIEPSARVRQDSAALLLVVCLTLAASVLSASFCVFLVRWGRLGARFARLDGTAPAAALPPLACRRGAAPLGAPPLSVGAVAGGTWGQPALLFRTFVAAGRACRARASGSIHLSAQLYPRAYPRLVPEAKLV